MENIFIYLSIPPPQELKWNSSYSQITLSLQEVTAGPHHVKTVPETHDVPCQKAMYQYSIYFMRGWRSTNKLKADRPHPRDNSTHRQTPWTDCERSDGRTDGRTDSTKYIISLASWSIMFMNFFLMAMLNFWDSPWTTCFSVTWLAYYSHYLTRIWRGEAGNYTYYQHVSLPRLPHLCYTCTHVLRKLMKNRFTS